MICSRCTEIALPRMWCRICYKGSLPERKFTKKERKGNSGVCVKCKGETNRWYASAVAKRRKPSNAFKKRARQDALEFARRQVCPGYHDAVCAFEEERAKILVLVELRRQLRDQLSRILPAEVILHLESFLMKLCRGPHCLQAKWSYPIPAPPEIAQAASSPSFCFNCICCTQSQPPWFPRITDDPNPNRDTE